LLVGFIEKLVNCVLDRVLALTIRLTELGKRFGLLGEMRLDLIPLLDKSGNIDMEKGLGAQLNYLQCG
jgi:hypothetical protein